MGRAMGALPALPALPARDRDRESPVELSSPDIRVEVVPPAPAGRVRAERGGRGPACGTASHRAARAGERASGGEALVRREPALDGELR